MVTLQSLARKFAYNTLDGRIRMPHEVVDSLVKIISQLGSAANEKELLLLKERFIESLGRYSSNKYGDTGEIWQLFRREYNRTQYPRAQSQVAQNNNERFSIDECYEAIAGQWSPRRENY